MTAEQIIEAAKSCRTAKGLKLVWFIPSENRDFTAYAKDVAQRTAWLANAAAKGWELK